MSGHAWPRFYGSYLELELDSLPVVQDSVWAAWTAPGTAFIAKHLLSVPCDQRLSPEDMRYVGSAVHRLLTRKTFFV